MHGALDVQRSPTVMTPEPAGIKNKGRVEIECMGREFASSARLWLWRQWLAPSRVVTGPNAVSLLL